MAETKQKEFMEKTKIFFRYVLLLMVIFIWIIPVIWVIMISLKTRTDIFTIPPTIVFKPTLENYKTALSFLGISSSIKNSLIIATVTTLLTLLLAVPAGYAYSRLQFRFKKTLSFYTLFTQMAPQIGVLIPFFMILTKFRLFDSYFSLIVVHLTITVPVSVWLMITCFQDLPREMEEAAIVDGASMFTTFFRIMLPQVYGGMAVAGILSFIESWNEFLFASILSGPRVRTVSVALFSFLTTEESLWGPFAATGVMIMAPVIIIAFLAQKQIIKGLTFGAIK